MPVAQAGVRSWEHPGQDFHLVGLAALGGKTGLAGAAPVEIGLDVGGLERSHGRAAIDDAAQRPPMALAEGRHPEQVAEAVVGHAAS